MTQITGTFGGSNYQIITTGLNFSEAQITAEAAGGYLAIITSKEEDDFIYGLLGTASISTTAPDGGGVPYAWIGATDEVLEGVWQWVDGSAVASYTNWGSGSLGSEPDDFQGQDYAAIGLSSWPSGMVGYGEASQWNDVDGSNMLAYVIETPVNLSPTDIALDNNLIAENKIGLHISNLTGTDPNGGTLSYSITGGTDASMFEIVGSMLHLATSVAADYETKNQLVVELTATDSGGLTYNEEFTIGVIDVVESSDTLSNDIFYVSEDGYLTPVDGGVGVDTVQFEFSNDYFHVWHGTQNDFWAGAQSLYSFGDTSTNLLSIERIGLTDKGYALDLDGNAGIAAKTIIATFGADSLGSYMSAALSVVDGGTTLDGLCDLVADLSLIENEIGSSTNGSFVDHVYENVVGTAPSSEDHDTYTALLDNGTYTKSSLLALAANTTLTGALVTENSVDLIGVPGSADGELLALQYDIGLG